jgi:Carboxypeptidase regulatory-like domain
MNRRIGVLGLLLALVLLPMTAAAQTAQVGQVRVEVKDTSNAVLPGATVTLTSEERGVSRTGVTDSNGTYLFSVVSLGRYTVNVKLSSFENKTITGNLVEESKTTVVPVSLKIATVEVSTTVTGEVPIVDATNQTQETRLRSEEFQKMPIGRSYQSLMGVAPGVVGTGNVNAHGALTSNNVFLFDGVNTTDPTTGTFGNNLNFESIQELVVRTGAVSAEFGRGTGAIVDVITRSGTNRFEGSYKYLGTNDNWNAQNTTKSQAKNADGSCVCTSLERVKFDHVNPVNSFTLGGPVMKNKTWFFLAFENAKNTTAQRQTSPAPGFPADNYQQTTSSPFLNLRVTEQLASNHSFWFKVTRSPTNGFVIDYWTPSVAAAEKYSLTGQDQGGTSYAGQYTGVFGAKWTGEVLISHAGSFINVFPYIVGPTLGGSLIYDEGNNHAYNAATFEGYVKRPRNQATGALSYFTNWMGNPHNIKFGLDWQGFNSQNSFKYPTGIEYDVTNFNPLTRTFDPDVRLNYDTDPSKSTGSQVAFFVRDKMQLGPRLNVEAGVRVEKQSGHSDVDALTVDTTYFSPRVSASYAITKDSKTLGVLSYGRFQDAILQGFSDGFAAVPQQTNYDLYVWNGSTYVFDSRSEQGASTFKPNTNVSPRHLDEFTVGLDRQLSPIMGTSVRFITRTWGNFIDDVRTFNADRSINRVVQNVDGAERTYKGLELSIEKRYSNRWSAAANYTYSKTRGNHFGDDFTALHDFEDAQCRQTADVGLGDANGIIPCASVQPNLTGLPTFDRPHLFKYYGAYTYPSKWFDLTAGVVGSAQSKTTYSKQRTLTVLLPGTTSSSGQTLTYFYEPRGSERIDGMNATTDFSLEGSYKKIKNASVGAKFEIFNVFGSETQVAVNNVNFCNSTGGSAAQQATCSSAVANFGTATARGSFLSPQTYRLTFLFRYNMR